MEKKFRRIGVLTSGGDAPGMNAAIKSVTAAALAHGVEVVGIIGGYRGLIDNNVKYLTTKDVADIVSRGGTALYSARCTEFMEEAGVMKAVETCKKHEIDGMVVIGGDGTFRGAYDLSAKGIPCIGLPGTIDNDITATDVTIGFDTAMTTGMDICDKLRDTCESHSRCNVVELMGRNAGYIALNVAAAVNAVAVVTKEIPFDKDAGYARMKKLRAAGQQSFIVVVAEGVGGEFGEQFVKEIEENTGIEARFCRPAHILRGGVPTLGDRVFAAKVGAYAVEMLLQGKSNIVICQRKGEICECDLNVAFTVDRMYKGKMKPEELDKHTPEEIAFMKALCEERVAEFKELYDTVELICC